MEVIRKFLATGLEYNELCLIVLIFKLCESQNSLVVLKLSVRISATAVREESAAIKVVISKLEDFGSTVLRKLSDKDVEEQRAETRALWEPSGDV